MKKKKETSVKALLVLTSLFPLALTGCSAKATQPESEMDRQVKAEPEANSPEEIQKRAAETFSNAPGLTPEQKQKLTAIYQRTYAEAMSIRTEIGKSKSLLFKTVATKDYNSSEVDRLKQKIVDLDQKRLNVMFQALAEVQAVVGYGKDKDEYYRHFRDYEVPRGRILSAD